MRLRLISSILGLSLFVAMTAVAAHADGCVGACGTDTANGDVTNPPGFSSYTYVTTNGGLTGGGTLPAVFGSSGVLSTDGSTFTTSAFSTTSGESISFEFNYVTSDGSSTFPDYAWAALISTDGGADYLIFSAQTQPTGNTVPGLTLPPLAAGASLTPPTSPIMAGSGPYGGGPVWNELGGYSGDCYSAGCGLTGWIGSNFTGEAADNYVIEFGVSNATDTLYDSGLAFAGVEVGGAPITGAVPEPSALLLMLIGLGSLVSMMAVRKAKGLPIAA
jgi:PEP-CTERM motif